MRRVDYLLELWPESYDRWSVVATEGPKFYPMILEYFW